MPLHRIRMISQNLILRDCNSINISMKSFRQFIATKDDEIRKIMEVDEPLGYIDFQNKKTPIYECFGKFYIKETNNNIRRIDPPIKENK